MSRDGEERIIRSTARHVFRGADGCAKLSAWSLGARDQIGKIRDAIHMHLTHLLRFTESNDGTRTPVHSSMKAVFYQKDVTI